MENTLPWLFKKPVTEIIPQRVSCRSYTSQRITASLLEKINETLSQPHIGPWGGRVRFHLLEKEKIQELKKIKLGTYGIIHGAHTFIAGAIENGNHCFEDYGYLLERIILFLTDLGLGTCWIGGTFNRGGFSKALNLKKNEIIPAITPVGYPNKSRTIRDRLLRWGAGSNYRKPWSELFFADNFSQPLDQEKAGKYSLPLEMVRLGPSASNRQPWRIIWDERNNCFHFILKRTKGYLKTYQGVDLQRIDMGIAMCHFELTAIEVKLSGCWALTPINFNLHEGEQYLISWKSKLIPTQL